jgi:hypothetical protein
VTEDETKAESEVVEEHPRGALLFILIFLVLLALMWTHMYPRSFVGWISGTRVKV